MDAGVGSFEGRAVRAAGVGVKRSWQALSVGVSTPRGWRGRPSRYWPIDRSRKGLPRETLASGLPEESP